VVVDDLDVLRPSLGPPETNTPLLVDADAVGTSPVSLELLEPVPRRHPQIIERLGGIENEQLSQSGTLNILGELARAPSLPDKLGFPIRERPQHTIRA
jgi:hypothetical protein